ncbi:MAG: hypothetical protein ACYCXF_00890 [Thermoleophilia bacterium]
MNRYDCDVCLSAGSVNKWGFCEICGEDLEDPESRVMWHDAIAVTSTTAQLPQVEKIVATLGQDAA